MKLIKILFYSFIFIATTHATDHRANEGVFKNTSTKDMYCYGDNGEKDVICQVKIESGQSCRGDAISLGLGETVYKVPNRSQWDCSLIEGRIDCSAQNIKSTVLLVGASFKNGFSKYHNIEFDSFIKLMGSKHIYECDKDNKRVSDEPLYITNAPACI